MLPRSNSPVFQAYRHENLRRIMVMGQKAVVFTTQLSAKDCAGVFRTAGDFGTSCCFHGRFGSAGHRPPRVSIAMAMKASGVWNPLARLVSARRCVFVASESALDRP